MFGSSIPTIPKSSSLTIATGSDHKEAHTSADWGFNDGYFGDLTTVVTSVVDPAVVKKVRFDDGCL